MKSLILLLILIFSNVTFAAIDVQRRDMKLASQVMIEKQVLTTPILASTTRVKGATASSASVVTNITTFADQPDVARNITVTTGGTTADCAAGNITVTGTNILGAVISEAIAITANQAGTSSGAKAFASVTSVSIPVQDGAGCTYAVGVGDVLGLKRCMDKAGHVVMAVFNGAYEGTRPTCLADADEVEKNTCDINGTLDGAKDVELYFIQNFACLP